MAAPSDLAYLTLTEAAVLVARRKISPVELVRAQLERIERLNPRLTAFITVAAEESLAEARRAERRIARKRGGKLPPLFGVPVALKDNIWTRGLRTTAGSKILRDFVPQEDATVVRRLREAGAIILGKTNLHEFAYGVTTTNEHFGAARNPWNTECIPGGSSGGSGAALAAGICYGSVGSDTGGSIRIPAALCGVVGLKPTFGRVSCHGVVPLCVSLDHAGPLARTVLDAALLLSVIAGHDPLDPNTLDAPVENYSCALNSPLVARRRSRASIRLGLPKNYYWENLDPEIERLTSAAVREFEKMGARVEEVSLPLLAESVTPSTHIALAEAREFHERSGWYPARAADYSEDVRKRLEMGADVKAVDYLAAREFVKKVRAGFGAALARVDAIVAPTVPVSAPRVGEKMVRPHIEEEPVRAALLRLNRPANLTGHPAISIPCGFTETGLPVGLQLIGRALGEADLLRLAHAYERAHDWSKRRPPLD